MKKVVVEINMRAVNKGDAWLGFARKLVVVVEVCGSSAVVEDDACGDLAELCGFVVFF